MILRRLKQDEHGLTRKLWEEVFTEDTQAFLDYYYFIKTKENRIYVIEEDGEIRSMLQLNPYRIRIEAEEFPSDYIIAVSTQKEYRSRGYMESVSEDVSRGDVSGEGSFYFSDAGNSGNLHAL